jgi:hypothetical protein
MATTLHKGGNAVPPAVSTLLSWAGMRASVHPSFLRAWQALIVGFKRTPSTKGEMKWLSWES